MEHCNRKARETVFLSESRREGKQKARAQEGLEMLLVPAECSSACVLAIRFERSPASSS